MMKRTFSVALVIVLAILTASCQAVPIGDAEQVIPTVTPIPTAPAAAKTTYTVQRGTVQQILEFRGRWLPRDQFELAFEVNGQVRSVEVNRDDTVTAGELVAVLQIEDLENQLIDQQFQLESALRSLEQGGGDSENTVESAAFALANAQLGLQSQEIGLPWASVNSAWSQVEVAQRSLVNAQRNYDDLISRADTPPTSVDSAAEQVIQAQENLEQARISYQSAATSYRQAEIGLQQTENSVLQQQLQLDDALSGGSNAELLQAVDQARLAIDQTRSKIVQSSLYSTIDGIVLEVGIQRGDTVEAFDEVITLAIPDPKEAIADISANDIRELSIGDIGVCQVNNRPETAVQCIVRQLPLSSSDVDQSVRVAATLVDVQQGQLIDIEMPLDVREDVLWLPPEAINTFQNRTFVVIQTPEGERVRDVQIGLRTEDRVEVESGIEEGDIVIQQ